MCSFVTLLSFSQLSALCGSQPVRASEGKSVAGDGKPDGHNGITALPMLCLLFVARKNTNGQCRWCSSCDSKLYDTIIAWIFRHSLEMFQLCWKLFRMCKSNPDEPGLQHRPYCGTAVHDGLGERISCPWMIALSPHDELHPALSFFFDSFHYRMYCLNCPMTSGDIRRRLPRFASRKPRQTRPLQTMASVRWFSTDLRQGDCFRGQGSYCLQR